MKRLFVLYDAHCGLCRRLRVWLAQQPAFVPLAFLAFDHPEVVCRFPKIEKFHPEDELVVISDQGDLWRGEHAWIMVLWALVDYREWALRLASPVLLPLARRVCVAISDRRYRISHWIWNDPMTGIQRALADVPAESCHKNDRLCRTREGRQQRT